MDRKSTERIQSNPEFQKFDINTKKTLAGRREKWQKKLQFIQIGGCDRFINGVIGFEILPAIENPPVSALAAVTRHRKILTR